MLRLTSLYAIGSSSIVMVDVCFTENEYVTAVDKYFCELDILLI